MGQLITKAFSGGYVNQAKQTTKYPKQTDIPLRASSGQNRYAFFYTPNSIPLSANAVDAKFRVKNAKAWTGTNTLRLRMVTAKWTVSELTYKKAPAVATTYIEVTKTGGQAAGTVWEFDIDAAMQAVADAGPWWGFRIETTASSDRVIGGFKSIESLRPELEVNWTDSPEIPDELYPSAGRIVSGARPFLRCNFVDLLGDTQMKAYHVIASYNANMSSPFQDITQDSAVPIHYMTVDVTPNTTVYWRMEVQDGAGIWSGLSRIETFKRIDHVLPVLINPAPGTPGYVEDPTPRYNWSFPGTQKSFQVVTTDLDRQDLKTGPKLTSTETTWTPTDPLLYLGDLYETELRIWDDKNREANIQPAYASVKTQLRFSPNSGTTAVANLTAVKNPDGPGAILEFTRADFPDSFAYARNGVLVQANIAPEDILKTAGTPNTFRIIDPLAPKRKSNTWIVIPTVNDHSPSVNTPVTATWRDNASWIAQRGGANAIALFGVDTTGLTFGDQSSTKQVIDSDENIVVKATRTGRSGTVTATIAKHNGVSADEYVARLEAIRTGTDPRVFFTWLNQSMYAAIDSIQWKAEGKTEEVIYRVSFTLYYRRAL